MRFRKADYYFIAAFAAAIAVLLFLAVIQDRLSWGFTASTLPKPSIVNNTQVLGEIKHTRIFFTTEFPAHFDVSLPLAGMIERALQPHIETGEIFSLDVYYPLPLRFGFQRILDQHGSGLYTGTINPKERFLEDFTKSFEEGRNPTLLVLTTCEHECVYSHSSGMPKLMRKLA
jgi:hypothetical protein